MMDLKFQQTISGSEITIKLTAKQFTQMENIFSEHAQMRKENGQFLYVISEGGNTRIKGSGEVAKHIEKLEAENSELRQKLGKQAKRYFWCK